MHVAALQLFTPPQGAGRRFARDTYEAMLASDHVQPAFRKHPSTVLGGISNLGWSYDDDIELDYHVRRSALPAPGRVRDLLELTSRLHGSLLDRHRPLWEAHLIEGLRDGRFAVYIKLHHALVDGVSGLRLIQRSLSTDPTRQQDSGAMVVAVPAYPAPVRPSDAAARHHDEPWNPLPGLVPQRCRWAALL